MTFFGLRRAHGMRVVHDGLEAALQRAELIESTIKLSQRFHATDANGHARSAPFPPFSGPQLSLFLCYLVREQEAEMISVTNSSCSARIRK